MFQHDHFHLHGFLIIVIMITPILSGLTVSTILAGTISNKQNFTHASVFSEFGLEWESVYPKIQVHPLVSMITFSNFTTLTYYGCRVKWGEGDCRAVAVRKWLCKPICYTSCNGEEYKRVVKQCFILVVPNQGLRSGHAGKEYRQLVHP